MSQRAFALFLSTACLTSLFALSLPPPLGAQSYVFTRFVDDNTQRPDGKGLFNISGAGQGTTPSFDGHWAVFREYGPINTAAAQALWSFNALDGTFTKLADLDTPVPGGVGNFSDLSCWTRPPL